MARVCVYANKGGCAYQVNNKLYEELYQSFMGDEKAMCEYLSRGLRYKVNSIVVK